MTKLFGILFTVLLYGCVTSTWFMPPDITSSVIKTGTFDIMTYSRLTDATSPVHIYIEGDGNSFDAYGYPTPDPTPHSTFMRDMMARDKSANVAYIARPCQYIKTPQCDISDWTDARFSKSAVDSIAYAIHSIAKDRPIILIGYSGGAMISGLIITHYPKLNITEWITIAGVLNHSDWTNHFGDSPLTKSLDLTTLPDIPQKHYVAESDSVVPFALSQRWVGTRELITIPNSTHYKFPEFELNLQQP